MGNPPWACLRKKDLGWDRGVESKKVVQHVYLVGAKSIYRVAEKDKEYPQLLNAIHSAEKIVYLCGAGASMSIGSHRLSWTNWIAEGRKYLTIPEQNELNLKIGSWTAEELIDAATFLLGKLKSSGAYQTFMNILHRVFGY